MEKINLKQYKKLAKSIVSSRINYIENMQKFIIFFIEEYNKALSNNATSFCEVLKSLQKYADKDFIKIKKFLTTYTNIETLLLKDNKLTTKAVDKKTLVFNCEVAKLPCWYSSETTKKADKVFNEESFRKSLKQLYKKYAEVEGLSEQLKHILTIINI